LIFKGEKLLFSLTFYIYYTGIFKTFQIFRRRVRGLEGVGWCSPHTVYFLFLPSLSIYIIIEIRSFFKFYFLATQGMRPENLTFKIKFLDKFIWKFDLFCQISFAAPMEI